MTLLKTPQISPPKTGRPASFDLPGTLCATVGLAGLLAEYGFFEPPVGLAWCRLAQATAVLAFLAVRLIRLATTVDKIILLRRYWLDLAVLPVAAIAAAFSGAPNLQTILQAGAIYVTIRQAGLLAHAVLERAVQAVAPPAAIAQPIRLLWGSYLVLVILGGLMLALPKATTADHRNAPFTHLLNSAFTATSAACTAGLNVYELPRDYTLFGKMVILGLVQLGGLGMLVFGTLFGMLLVRRLTDEQACRVWLDPPRVRRLITAIIAGTVGLEALGAALLYPAFADQPGLFEPAFHAIFHAVNAFCNAGFALQRDSLAGQGGLWQIYGVILPLAVLGSLGFPVLYEIVHRLGNRSRSAPPLLPLPAGGWSLHARLALTMSLCLFATGALGLLLFETPGRTGYWYVGKGNLLAAQDSVQLSPDWMRSHEGPQRLFDALFQAAAAPTTGLHTVPVDAGAMSPASHVLLMLLMFVGGAPASTAGGIKTVALAVIGLYVLSIFRRKGRPEAFGRLIPVEVVRLALGLFFVSIAWLIAVVLVLAHTERAAFLSIAFEAVSALGTSGLSLGLTPTLTALGKGAILLTMLAGRLGPLAMVVALAGRGADDNQPQSCEPVVLG